MITKWAHLFLKKHLRAWNENNCNIYIIIIYMYTILSTDKPTDRILNLILFKNGLCSKIKIVSVDSRNRYENT